MNSKYDKVTILKSDKFATRRDLLSVLLEDDKKYTIKQVENEIVKYLKGGIR